jgi:hypothetical protein
MLGVESGRHGVGRRIQSSVLRTDSQPTITGTMGLTHSLTQ